MKSLLRTGILLVGLIVIVPMSIAAQQYKIDKSIWGFRLGERKSEVLSRLNKAGIAYELESKDSQAESQMDSYVLEQPLANTDGAFDYVALSFANDYLAMIGLRFNGDASYENLEIARQAIQKEWNIVPTKRNSPFAGIDLYQYDFKRPPVHIWIGQMPNLSRGLVISFMYIQEDVVNAMTGAKGTEEKQPLLGKQF